MPRVPPVTLATGLLRRSPALGVRSTLLAPLFRDHCRGVGAVKSEISLAAGETLHVQRDFAGVIIAPLTGFSARCSCANRNVVPAARPVVDRMQQQPLMLRIGAEIDALWFEKRLEDSKAGLKIARAICSGTG